MDEITEQEVGRNKSIRGYIIRSLVKGIRNTLHLRQLTDALDADGCNMHPHTRQPREFTW